MKRILVSFLGLSFLVGFSPARAAEPLRIFLRGGPKTHGPAGNGLHDHERWVQDWTGLLRERGARVQGGLRFPTAAELAETDVLVMFAPDAGDINAEQRVFFERFLKRGGGVVCLHDAVCGHDPEWFKTVMGGAWDYAQSKWFENEISFYYVDNDHPITKGASNFDVDDEIYWGLRMMPEARILAASWEPDRRNMRNGRPFPHIYGIIPQMWVYEKDNHRAFVSILGHKYGTLQKPHVRAVLLRGIAWAGKRDVDTLCSADELASLRYPEGGPAAPEKSAALLETHPDFTLNLVAAEPLIRKAINLDWDPAGRLWVAETPEYPNGRNGLRPDMAGEEWKDHGGVSHRLDQRDRPTLDRISILSDTDGDGRMDRRESFYDGLELVTSFVFYRDGVIVSMAPDVLWIRDTDGDGKGETVQTLYTGLGIGDRHAVINNLRWGFDGWIYATHGYSAGTVTSPDGGKNFGRIGSGVVRFKPDGSAFEQFSSKGGNTWGLDIAWDDEVFFTQPTSGDLLNHVVLSESTLAEGKVGNTTSFKPIIQHRKSFPLIEYDNLAYVQIDQVGYFTAAAGCAIYDGGTWPSDWNYHYFTTEPTINIVHEEAVEPEGVSYQAHKNRQAEFIGGRDRWFRPIETRVGPDGALYIIDFYNQAVIHNDTRGPRHNRANAAVRPDRDHYFGRIWRVDHKQARHLEIPDLTGAAIPTLTRALEHPNRHVRMSALRLLVERGGKEAVPSLDKLAASAGSSFTRVAALWALSQLGAVDADLLRGAISSPDAAVKKNALRIAPTLSPSGPVQAAATKRAILNALEDSDGRVQLEAVLALGRAGIGEAEAAALVRRYPSLEDAWLQSAVVGLMSQAPLEFLNAALAAPDPGTMSGVVDQLSRRIAASQDAGLAARLVMILAGKPAAADGLKRRALESLSRGLKAEAAPAWDDSLKAAFDSLLKSSDPGVPAAALPLVIRWDTSRSLAGDLKPLVQTLLTRLAAPGTGDEERVSVATSLLGVRGMDARIVPAVPGLLTSAAGTDFKSRLVLALGATADPAVGPQLARVFPQVSPEIQEAVLGQSLKRTDWALAFLEAVKSGVIPQAGLRPSAVHSLRNHSDPTVAAAANRFFDEVRGPELKEKNALIAKFTPAVEQPGDVVKGKELFVQNCATCHQFGDLGREVGPNLNGMGAHGPAELLVHVLDPNRAVEDSYIATSIETEDGEIYDGIVTRENRRNVVLRNAAGETEIARNQIKTRRSTGRTLMPDGFEALGEAGLRNLLAFITAAEARYRFLDLTGAFTADTRKGLYATDKNPTDSFKFKKFGPVMVDGIPFNVVNPVRTPNGHNVIVLQGGPDPGVVAKTYPRRVEVPVGFPVSRLHFLGGVGGWGYPFGGEASKDKPVMKVTVVYEDGRNEEWIFKNGLEFADWIRDVEVPGSKLVSGVVTDNQLRYFSKSPAGSGPVEKVILESYDTEVAPTTVAITAERGGPGPEAAPVPTSLKGGAAQAPALAPKGEAAGKHLKVLIVGGGSSHDFNRWFNEADVATLNEGGLASATYTDKPADIAGALPGLDALYLSNNQPIPDSDTRRAIFDFVNAGKGLLLVHPAVWYNWNDWPEYNRVLAGGGSRGHDALDDFDVTVKDAAHPVMAGVPARFHIVDELYWFEPDPKGTPIRVLATAHSKRKDKDFPMVWVVQHPKARIVCIALGHDGQAHHHAAYRRLLRNALVWVAGN
jgi:putative membrane-bound dehydrogenase-like protein